MIASGTLEATGFLTLTVGDSGPEGFRQVWDSAEASRRINSLRSNLLGSIFEKAIIVSERHKSGAIHFHLVGIIAGRPDIRSGFDHEAAARGDYSSASPELRRLWGILRDRLPSFGFGRAELTPIRKTGEAIAAYVAKYIEKNLFNRLPEDKGKKLVRYIGFEGFHLKPNDFAWATERAIAWRRNAEAVAGLVGVKAGVAGRAEVAEAFGPRWAFRLTRCMNGIRGDNQKVIVLATFPERESARAIVARNARARWMARREQGNSALPFVPKIFRRPAPLPDCFNFEAEAA